MTPDLHKAKRQRQRFDFDMGRVEKIPHSLEAEQGVLGCTLLDGRAVLDAFAGKVDAIDFYDLRHQVLFRTLFEMWDEGVPIDLITVQQRLKDAGQLEAIGGLAYITALMDCVPSAANCQYYVDIMLEKSSLRGVISACSDTLSGAFEGEINPDEVISKLEKDVERIRMERSRVNSSGFITSKDAAERFIRRVEERIENKGKLSGITSGFADLDEETDGFQRGEFCVIAARPSVGKSALMVAFAIAAAVEAQPQVPTLIITCEMSIAQLQERFVASIAKVPLKNYRKGLLDDYQLRRTTTALARLAKAPIYYYEALGGLPVDLIANEIRHAVRGKGVKLAMVDYLQKLRGSGNHESRTLEVGYVSNSLLTTARKTEVALVSLAQLNRESIKDKRLPNLADLRESGAIEQDADTVALLHRPKVTDEDKGEFHTQATLLLAKHRQGALNDIRLAFLPEYARFENAAKVAEQQEMPVKTWETP